MILDKLLDEIIFTYEDFEKLDLEPNWVLFEIKENDLSTSAHLTEYLNKALSSNKCIHGLTIGYKQLSKEKVFELIEKYKKDIFENMILQLCYLNVQESELTLLEQRKNLLEVLKIVQKLT